MIRYARPIAESMISIAGSFISLILMLATLQTYSMHPDDWTYLVIPSILTSISLAVGIVFLASAIKSLWDTEKGGE